MPAYSHIVADYLTVHSFWTAMAVCNLQHISCLGFEKAEISELQG